MWYTKYPSPSQTAPPLIPLHLQSQALQTERKNAENVESVLSTNMKMTETYFQYTLTPESTFFALVNHMYLILLSVDSGSGS